MSVVVDGSNGLIFNDASTQTTAATGFGFKNRIINGAMMIDQRNAGASVTWGSGSWTFAVDRFQGKAETGSGHTMQQSNTAPTGFARSLLFTVGTGGSPSAGNTNSCYQGIEGLNLADMAFGTATASAFTLSFWVKSSVTGTFSGAIANGTQDRSYPFTYTISTTGWEQKYVTIAGDTSGTWGTTNAAGMLVWFDWGNGSNYRTTAGAWATGDYRGATGAVNLIATSGATCYITGVQLEKGSTKTDFDYRSYGHELGLCYRYYFKQSPFTDAIYMCTYTGSGSMTYIYWGTPMRATPTVTAIRTDTSASISTYPTLTGATLYTASTGVAAASSVTATAEL